MKKIAFILLLAGVVIVSGCTGTGEVVETGDYVSVDYIGELEDGTVFDTSIEEVAITAGDGVYSPLRSYEPLEFTVGEGQMIEGFDKGVLGMSVGESKTLVIPPEEAYGPYRDDLIQTIPIENLPVSETPYAVGDKLLTSYGQQVTITNVTDTDVEVDFNNPLAGKTLVFKITLVSIGQK